MMACFFASDAASDALDMKIKHWKRYKMSLMSENTRRRLLKQYCSAELSENQKADEKQSLQSHRDAAHYIIFCINILCSHILFPYLPSLHKKCFWSLWHMQTLVQSEFLILFHLPEWFFFGTV